MSTEVTIFGYPTNGPDEEKPRKPLVHLISADEWGAVHSISFHPDDAQAITDAILRAGRAAKRNRKIEGKTIRLRPNG